MHAKQEGPFPGVVEPREVLHHVDQIVVGLVVGAADADVPVMIAELEQQRRQVVGQLAVVDAGGAQRVAHRHVREERRRRDHERAQRQQGVEQVGLVEQVIGSRLEEQPLVPRSACGVTARQGERGHAVDGELRHLAPRPWPWEAHDAALVARGFQAPAQFVGERNPNP